MPPLRKRPLVQASAEASSSAVKLESPSTSGAGSAISRKRKRSTAVKSEDAPDISLPAVKSEVTGDVKPNIGPACLEAATYQPEAGDSFVAVKSVAPVLSASRSDVKPTKRSGKRKAVEAGEELRPGRVRAKPPKTTLARGTCGPLGQICFVARLMLFSRAGFAATHGE